MIGLLKICLRFKALISIKKKVFIINVPTWQACLNITPRFHKLFALIFRSITI